MVFSKDMKKAIAFGLILGAIISICNLCFASDIDQLTEISGVSISTSTGKVSNLGGYTSYYIEVEAGKTYTFDVTGKALRWGVVPSLEIGTDAIYYSSTSTHLQTSYTADTDGYILIFGGSNTDQIIINDFSISSSGLLDFVNNLSSDLSISNLNNIFAFCVPLLAISVLFGLGFYLIKKLIGKIKKAKGGV